MVRRHSQQSLAARAVWLVATLGAAGLCQAADPLRVLDELRAARLDPGRAVQLRDVTIDIGPARLVIESATLVPATPVAGRPIEVQLSGRLRFRVAPPDDVEASQLELFTGRRVLDVAVEEVVLAVADERLVRRLMDSAPKASLDAADLARVESSYRRWIDGAERRRAGVEASLLRAIVGDAGLLGFVAAWCRSSDVGDFYAERDPEDPEAFTVASFVPIDVRGWDRRRLARHIRFQQRKGRFLDVRLGDLGAWDIWLSGLGIDDAGPESTRGPAFESRHYDLEITVRRKRRLLDGRARVTIETLRAGRTTVPFDIHGDLRVRQAYDGGGGPLPFVQIGTQVVVVLPEAPAPGARFDVDLRYTGRALQWVGRGVHDLVDTDEWYPHCGEVDRATYDTTLRWPHKQELLASGRLVEAGRAGRYRWERRRIDRPAIAASFVLGDLRVESRRIGDIDLRIGFDRSSIGSERERAVETLVSALEFLERTWGEFPVRELTVVVLPRDFAQSYLGFVTLSRSMLDGASAGALGVGDWVRETMIAHELAHQWWGNVVGWASYRDQWLSESMANYTALLYWAERNGVPGSPLGELAAGWRESLERLSADGRTFESFGPLVLGHRLNSSKANAYQPIVYRKGAVVLAMLARAVGPERFHEVLRGLLEGDEGRVLTTADFLAELGAAAQVDLDGFSRTFVYGTGIPVFYYEYGVERAGAGWIVRGAARRRPQFRAVVRAERGAAGWDVVRDFVPVESAETTRLSVPFRVLANVRMQVEGAPQARATALDGELTLRDEGRFEVETDLEPATFRLDPHGEVLARFVPADDPRRTLRLQAEDHVARGDPAGAEASLRRALAATPQDATSRGARPAAYRDAETRRDEARIHATLVRLYLDEGRIAEAQGEIATVEELLAGDRGALWFEREVLAARLELRGGDAEGAQRRLRRLVGGDAEDTPRVRAELAAEAWTLAAIVAHTLGLAHDRATALDAARNRGADVTALRAEIPAQKP